MEKGKDESLSSAIDGRESHILDLVTYYTRCQFATLRMAVKQTRGGEYVSFYSGAD